MLGFQSNVAEARRKDYGKLRLLKGLFNILYRRRDNY